MSFIGAIPIAMASSSAPISGGPGGMADALLLETTPPVDGLQLESGEFILLE